MIGNTIGRIPVTPRLKSLNKISKLGRAKFQTQAEAAQKQLKDEGFIDKFLEDTNESLLERYVGAGKHLQNGKAFGSAADAQMVVFPKTKAKLLMGYDEVLQPPTQIGYFDGILAYIDQTSAKSVNRLGIGTFANGLNNVVKKFRPQVAQLQTTEGRTFFYHNQMKVAADKDAFIRATEIGKYDMKKLFGAETKDISATLKGSIEGADDLVFNASNDFVSVKISRESIPAQIYDTKTGIKDSDNPMFSLFENVKEIGGITNPEEKILVNLGANNIVTLTTPQGFKLGTLEFDDIVSGLTNETVAARIGESYRATSKVGRKKSAVPEDLIGTELQEFSGKHASRLKDFFNRGSKQTARRQNMAGQKSVTLQDKVTGDYVSDFAMFKAKLGDTAIISNAGTKPIREKFVTKYTELQERIKKFTKKVGADEDPAFRIAEIRDENLMALKDASKLYDDTIKDYFDTTRTRYARMTDKQIDADKLIPTKSTSVRNGTVRGADRAGDEKTFTQVKENLDALQKELAVKTTFETPEEALVALRNLDDGLKKNQLRINTNPENIDDITQMFAEQTWDGITREIMRQFGKQNKNIDIMAPKLGARNAETINSMFGNGNLPKMLTKNQAFRGSSVIRDLRAQFGKTADEISGKSTNFKSSMETEFKKIYKEGLDGTQLEREMPIQDFLDRAGFVVGYSHETASPIRLYDTGYFNLNDDQINFLDEFYNIFDEYGTLATENGVKFEDLKEFSSLNYVHHAVDDLAAAKKEFLLGTTTRNVSDYGVAGTLGRSSALRERKFRNFVSEGFEEKGVVYGSEPADIVNSFVKMIQNDINNTHTLQRLKVQGAKGISKIQMAEKKLIASRNLSARLKAINTATIVGGGGVVRNQEEASKLARIMSPDNPDNMVGVMDSLYTDVSKVIKEEIGNNSSEEILGAIRDRIKKNPALKKAFDKMITDETTRAEMLENASRGAKELLEKKYITTNQEVKKILGLPYGIKDTKLRQLKNYNLSPEGNNVEVLKDVLFDEDLAIKLEKNLGINQKNFADIASEKAGAVGDVIRLFQTGFDLGTPLLQGLPTLVTRPDIWTVATIRSLKAAFSPNKGGRVAIRNFYLEKNKTGVLDRMNRRGILMGASGNDYYRATQTANLSKKLETLQYQNVVAGKAIIGTAKAGGKVLERAQASFEGLGDFIRVALFEAHEKQITNSLKGVKTTGSIDNIATFDSQFQGKYLDLEQAYIAGEDISALAPDVNTRLNQLTKYVNQSTGAFSSEQAMISNRQANFERAFVLFSPAYTRASMGLIGSVLSGGVNGDMAHKALSNMLMAGVGMHFGLAKIHSEVTGEPIETFLNLDPSQSKFLTSSAGGVNVGVGSFWNGAAKLLAQTASDPAFRGDVLDSPLLLSGSGKGQAGFDESGIRSKLANNPIVRWLRGRSSPVGSTMWDLGMGSNFLGEELTPTSFGEDIAKDMLPFWGQSALEAGLFTGAAGISAATEVIGLRTFEVSDWERRAEIRDMLAMSHKEKLWRDLSDVERRDIMDIEDASPNGLRLQELEENMKERVRTIGGGELDAARDKYENIREDVQGEYDIKIADLNETMHTKVIDPETGRPALEFPNQFIDREKRARAERNQALEALKNERLFPEFAPLMEYLDSFNDFDPNEKPEDFFAEQYANAYFDEKWQNEDYYDFAGRDREIERIKNSWGGDGDELVKYARTKLFGTKSKVHPLTKEYYDGVENYFDRYYKGAEDQVFQVIYNGTMNELLETYRKAPADLKQQIKETNPEFKKAWARVSNIREAMRKLEDPKSVQLDAFLYRFGVGGVTTLQNPLNTGRKEELKQLDAMDSYYPEWKVAGQ